MNWKLIFALSLFGVAMGIASLFGLTRHIEPLLWIVIFVFYAWWIAKHCSGKYFLHGFLVSVLNGVWISLIHAGFFSLYMSNNPEMVAGLQNLPRGVSPRVMMMVVGPIIGILTGVVAGLFAWVAAKLFNRKSAVA